jgi:hypothetical protein
MNFAAARRDVLKHQTELPITHRPASPPAAELNLRMEYGRTIESM